MTDGEPPVGSGVDEYTTVWWDAARSGRLIVQSCDDCGHVQHPPRASCNTCRSTSLSWSSHDGHGVVGAATRLTTTTYPAFKDRLPYWVAQIELAPDAHLLANVLDDTDIDEIPGGSSATVVFAERDGALFPFIRLEA